MDKFAFHPFLIAIFPIIFLFAYNADKVEMSVVLVPIAISLVFTILLFFCLKIILKDDKKRGIIVSVFLILFFSYGHLVALASILSIDKLNINKYFLLLITEVIFLFLAAFFITRTSKKLSNVTFFLNVLSIALIVMPSAEIIKYELKVKNFPEKQIITSVNKSQQSRPSDLIDTEIESIVLPDIYYIILDGYARADILEEFYQYDNSEFIEWLEKKGFYVAEKSRPNYPQTYQSLSSSLNLKYINYLADIVGKNSDDRSYFGELIENNEVQRFLKNNGYIFVTFTSAFAGTDKNPNADIYMTYKMNLNEFNNVLISTTPLGFFGGKNLQYSLHRNKILYAFDNIPTITQIKEPTFTFSHIMAPHPPFVFDSQGNEIQPDRLFTTNDAGFPGTKKEYKNNYVNQLIYSNQRTKEMIEKIIANSKNPLVIILQSDHGPAMQLEWEKPSKEAIRERTSILNAYFFSDKAQNALYENITPVNTFRIIFNLYFQADYEILEDKIYFTTWNRPYNFLKLED